MKRELFIILISGMLLGGCGTKRRATTVREQSYTEKTQSVKKDTIEIKPWVKPYVADVRHEMRGVWLTTVYGLDWPRAKADSYKGQKVQQEELLLILDRLRDDGFNTVFLQVRLRGNMIFASEYEPWANIFTRSGQPPQYDPLAFVVDACHRRGLACHAWLVTYPMGNNTEVNRSFRTSKPDWFVKHINEWYLDPGVPEVRTYLTKLCAEIVEKYPVDGIHLDYIRYPDHAKSFNDRKTFNRYGKGKSLVEWRRNNITELLREVKKTIEQINPYVQLSAAPLGKLKHLGAKITPHGWTAYESVYQDVEQWDREKLLDFVVPMMYYKDDLFEPFLLDWQRSLKHTAVIAGLGPYRLSEGSKAMRWKEEDILCQMNFVRNVRVDGVCFFRDEFISNRYSQMRESIRKEFRTQALLPELSRGKNYLPTTPFDVKLEHRGAEYYLSWQMKEPIDKRIKYRVWASIKDEKGDTANRLLADGVSDLSFKVPSSVLASAERIEFGVEAVNSFGVATPCEHGAHYMKQ